MKRRWRQDGPDYETGCMRSRIGTGLSLGPGGIVWWMHDNSWVAHAWTRNNDREMRREFKRLESAKRAVERWLEKHGD